MKRSKSKNIYLKWPSWENSLAYKNEKTNATTRPNMLKSVFSKSNSKKGSKSFQNTIKPFFTNKGIIANNSITAEEKGVFKSNTKETTEVFNNFYVYIAETTYGKRPSSMGNPNSLSQDRATV